jgi:transcriptional regulator with XRE-family HTH domain
MGQKLRELRGNKGLLLKEVAAKLQIDIAMIVKIEKGEKSCKQEYIKKVSKLLELDENELTILWLTGSFFPIVEKEQLEIEHLKQVKNRLNKN